VTIAEEQGHVASAYAHLDALIAHLDDRIRATATAQGTGTGQDLLEREALLDHLTHQLQSALAAQERLAFGRIDSDDGEPRHIGRIGLRDEQGDPLLIDWRAPNAAAFYQATAAQPMGVQRRRRIVTQGRTVTHVDDEDLTDVLALTQSAVNAVRQPRDGRMADIVATIAADQDRIIRQPLEQVTVVEGGPGTGKTVVALHRAAWLLYTYRDRLARDGVLIVGPSQAFLHYIDQVLPSLGETDVVLLTPGQLFPGVSTARSDAIPVAAIKGRTVMADVIAQAVQLRRRIPNQDLVLTLDDGTRIPLPASALKAAERGVPKNMTFHAGREHFLRRVVATLVTTRAREIGWDPGDGDQREILLADITGDANVRRELNLMWLPITPEQLVGRLLTDETFLAEAAHGLLTPDQQGELLRDIPDAWTVDDVPLLDEAAELLGPWDPHAAARDRQQHADHREALDAARRAVETFQSGSWVTAEQLLARDDTGANRLTVAERAMSDRTWIYGHVVVDEAQDLSAMAWRVIARRCHRKSATVVGDVQQAAHPAAVSSWQHAMTWAKGRLDIQTLTITYRITRQTAHTAIEALTAAGGIAPHLQAIRDGEPTQIVELPRTRLHDFVQEYASDKEGRSAVIVPDTWVDTTLITKDSPAFGVGADGLDHPIAVLRVADTKGLEFDRVFLVDPEAISAQRPRGADIYVAATRPTHELFWITLSDRA
jgi:DNA helicase IV